jgi:hypothetical protein
MRLDPGEAERIAARVAELLRRDPPPRFVDAAALARELSVERDWVYEHASELGAIRLGGARGRLRFDRRAVCERLTAGEQEALAGAREPARPLVGRRATERPTKAPRRPTPEARTDANTTARQQIEGGLRWRRSRPARS